MYSICFVIPSWHYWSNPLKLQPLWELYYATLIRENFAQEDVAVSIEDMRGASGESLTEVVDKIPEQDLYLYWIMKTGDSNEVQSIARILKGKYPHSTHAAGGTHVDMCTEECAAQFDAVVVGPGEESFKKIVHDERAGQLKKIYSQSYKEVPFSDTPFPQRDFLPREKSVNTLLFQNYGGVPGTSVFFSRGCVYHCSFCVYNVPNTLQVRSPKMMRAELRYLKEEYGVEGINLRDEVAIHPNPKISTQMFEALGESQVIWRAQTTTLATWEQLKMARESGCQELSIGVETVDDRVMKIIDKEWQTEKQIRDFMENCKNLGIKIKMCLIFGLPGEPRDIVERTNRFIEETRPDYVALSGFCPLPGSPIFNNPKKFGVKFIDRNWSKHAHLLYRFSNEEEVGLPFEYEEETPWGKSFSREQIKENIRLTQRWLESQQMVY